MRKSIKHLFGLTLGVSLALGLISSASAEGSVSVQVDGKTVQSAAYIDQNDRTMVSPDIADALGLTQKQEGSRVQFTRNGVSTYFTGSDATFSGSEMDTVPALRDGTLYVPLAYLAQAYNMPGLLGCRFQGSLCVYHLHRPHLAGWRTGPPPLITPMPTSCP